MADINEVQKIIKGVEVKLDLSINPISSILLDEEDNRSDHIYHLIDTNKKDYFRFKCEFYTNPDYAIVTDSTETEKYKPISADDNVIEWDKAEGVYDRAVFTIPTKDLDAGRLWCKITAYVPDIDFKGDEPDLDDYLNNKRTEISRVKTNVIIID